MRKSRKTTKQRSRHTFYWCVLVMASLFISGVGAGADECKAPELVCQAAANQDRSLYFRDHCRYQQKISIERFKVKGGNEMREELRETEVIVEPAGKADKTGNIPVESRVISDTDKNGNPKSKVNEKERTLLSFGAVWDLVFFPLLPEKVNLYNFTEVISERKSERWYRFVPKAEVTNTPLASGIAMLDPKTGEVLTIRIEAVHNLEVLDKEASKLRSFNATVDYSQYEAVLRMPTLASGGGVSGIRRFEGSFKFRFEEGKYRPALKID